MDIRVWKRILHKKRPAPLDDHLQEASPSGWSFARGRPHWVIICKRPVPPDDNLVIWEDRCLGMPKILGDIETLGFPEISGNTRNSGFTQNIGYYPLPDDFQTESGRVRYQMKYRVLGRVRVPAGHCHQCSSSRASNLERVSHRSVWSSEVFLNIVQNASDPPPPPSFWTSGSFWRHFALRLDKVK